MLLLQLHCTLSSRRGTTPLPSAAMPPKKLSKKDDEPEVAKAAKAQLNKWMEKAKRESSKK